MTVVAGQPGPAVALAAAAESQVLDALASLARSRQRGVVVDSPPGAGKSTLVVRASVALASAGEPVIVVAQTNGQVDDLVDRLARAAPSLLIGRLSAQEYVTAPQVARHAPQVLVASRVRDLGACRVGSQPDSASSPVTAPGAYAVMRISHRPEGLPCPCSCGGVRASAPSPRARSSASRLVRNLAAMEMPGTSRYGLVPDAMELQQLLQSRAHPLCSLSERLHRNGAIARGGTRHRDTYSLLPSGSTLEGVNCATVSPCASTAVTRRPSRRLNMAR